MGVGDAGASAISSIDNALWVWGSGTNGVIGDGQVGANRSSPSFVGNNFKKPTGGVTTFAAIDNNNYGYVWGNGANGVMGNNRTDISFSSPVLINSVDTWSSFSIATHILGIKTDGTLWAWGTNTNGELGLGDVVFRSSPTQVGTSSWSAVSAGLSFSAAIRIDGGLFTWGRNANGQLGHTDIGANGNSIATYRSSPVQIGLSPSGVTGYVSWTAIATGSDHMLAIKYSDNTLWSWGVNNAGQLGSGTVLNRSSPVQVGSSNWSQIQSGTSFVCGLTTDGKLYTWGNNVSGGLGDGTTVNKSNPTQIGTTTPNLSSPVQIGTSSWNAIGAGDGFSLAITTLGALFAWGRNDQGQLGDTTKVTKSSPVQVASGTSYVSVYAGGTHTVALKSDYTMYAWGYNVSGQVGDTSSVSRSSPVQVGTSSWVQITVGKDHSAAVRFDNTLWTWGLNSKGQLVDGTTVTKSSPVSVAGLWIDVEAGASHTSAIADNSTLFVFGDDRYGQ
jgi:alpha-tubulin suppressor-like RCC1 family protein